jgi:membrane-associated protein
MELLTWFIDFILHLDRHLVDMLVRFDVWIYAILFLIIFAETGFVVTPFLPGDSLLFAIGALAAVDDTNTLTAPTISLVLIIAAILGNTLNYAIGRRIGPPAFSGRYRYLKVDHLKSTEAYFQRYGGITVVISRFMPIVRTFAPFVAGVGKMQYLQFQTYNIAGGAAWVLIFVWGGYFLGNIPVIKENFGIVTILIIVLSVLPVAWAFFKRKTAEQSVSS